jgi:hypothetical protein
MVVSDLISKLKEFPMDMEVVFSDGYDLNFYHSNGIEIKVFENTVDIGLGGCKLTEEESDGQIR